MNNNNPGKYDDICTFVLESTQAKAVAIIIDRGILGSGFSVASVTQDWVENLPALLEMMAARIREERNTNE